MDQTKQIKRKYLIGGVLFGCLFPLIGTGVELSRLGLGLSLVNIVNVHFSTHLLLIIDLAPLILGGVALFLGNREAKLFALAQELKVLNVDKDARLGTLSHSIVKKNQDIQNVAYATAHDLKSTLRGISSLVTFINEEEDEREKKKYAEMLKLRLGRMEQLLNSMLEYIRETQRENKFESINLRQLSNDLIGSYSSPEVNIIIDSPDETVVSDLYKLRYILSELVKNSIKYSDKLDKLININFNNAGILLNIVYRDNGPGIDKKYEDKVFAFYSGLDRRDETESSGTGLAIVKRFVQDLKGEIGLEDSSNGVCFNINLQL